MGDSQLARRGGGLIIDARKRNETAELPGEDPGDNAALAHAENDSLAAGSVEQIKGLEAVVDMIRGINELGNCGRADGQDVAMEACDVIESSVEVVGREDQPGPGAAL